MYDEAGLTSMGDFLPPKSGGRAVSMVLVGGSQREKDVRMLPQRRSAAVRKRPTNQPTAHDLLGQKRSPIWLGSGAKLERIAVPEVRQCCTDDFDDNELICAIERLEAAAQEQEAARKFVAAAECLEQAVALRRKVCYNADGILIAAEAACCLFNFWGAQCLAGGQYAASLEILKKAEALTDVAFVPNYKRRVSLRATTFGNLCCYFRSRGKLNAALRFAEKALRIEQRYKDAEDPARTRLNYAVLLSAMGRHDEAVEVIEAAIAVVREWMQANGDTWPATEGESGGHGPTTEEVTVELVVAHHNLWVEHSRRAMHELGASCLLRAANVAKQRLGAEHPLTLKMEHSFATVKSLMPSKSPMSPFDEDDDLARYGVATSSPGSAQLPSLTPGPPKASTPMHLPPRPATVGASSSHAQHDGALGKLRLGSGKLAAERRSMSTSPPARPDRKITAEDRFVSKFDRGITPDEDSDRDTPQPQKSRASRHTPSTRCSTSMTPIAPRPPSSARRSIATPRSHQSGRASSVLGQTHVLDRTGADSVEPLSLPQRPATVAAHRGEMDEDRDDTSFHASWKAQFAASPSSRHGRSNSHDPPQHDIHEFAQLPMHSSSDEEQGGPHRGAQWTEDTEEGYAYWMQTAAPVSAAERIQARQRQFYSKEIMSDSMAKDERHNRRVHTLVNSRACQGTPNGMRVNKRREAWHIVHSARQVYVENGAAVCIQKCWRGYITRHTVQEQIARIAHETATQLQSLFRRYCIIQMLKKRVRSAMAVQASWRKFSTSKRQKYMNECKILVTRLVVGSTSRNRHWKLLKSGTFFQRVIRGSNTRNRLRFIGGRKTLIQKVVRGTVLRRRLRRLAKAVTTIAARWRGLLLRQKMAARHHGAELFQTLYRKYRARCRVQRMLKASAKIMALARGYRTRETMNHAYKAKLIQAWCRGILTRRRLRLRKPAVFSIQKAWIMSRQRQFFSRSVAIAIVLQKHARRHLTIWDLRERTKCAVSCEKLRRGFHWRRRLVELEAGALQLQTFWRASVARFLVVEMHMKAIQIQTFMRMVFARKRLHEFRTSECAMRSAWLGSNTRKKVRRLRSATQCIGRIFRGHVCRDRLYERQEAAKRIQYCWQRFRAGQTWTCRWNAAVKIQARTRARIFRRRYTLFRSRAVVSIQSYWKQRARRRQFVTQRHLVHALQASWRRMQSQRWALRQEESARSIQLAWRIVAGPRLVQWKCANAVRIQASFRGISQRRQSRQELKSANDIQRVIRGHWSRVHEKRRKAATRIVKWLRGRVSRLHYLRKREAAICVQKHSRRYLTASLAQLHRAYQAIVPHIVLQRKLAIGRQRDAAASWIQRCWWRKAAWIKLEQRRAAALLIQQSARRWLVLHRLAKCRAASIKLQAHSRCRIAQQKLLRKKRLQTMVSRIKNCGDARNYTSKMKGSSLIIGSTGEMHLTYRDIDVREVAAVQIQRIARGHGARRRVHMLNNVAPLGFQCFVRARKARAIVEGRRAEVYRQKLRGDVARELRLEQKEIAAATRIQAFARMHRARLEYRYRVHPAISKIQALCGMLWHRNRYLKKMGAILRIQTAWRMKATTHMEKREAAARRIQRAFQHHLSHTQFVACNDYRWKSRAATVIQAAWRCRRGMQMYKQKQVAACLIEAQMRASLGRKRYKAKLADAVMMQSSIVGRMFLCKRRVAERRQYALTLQAFGRRVVAKRRLRQRHAAATQLQALWRSAMNRHTVEKVRKRAATRIQAYARMRMCRPGGPSSVAHRKLAAARKIQKLTRGYLVRRFFRQQKAAVRAIQMKVRYRRFRTAFQEYRWVILAMQRVWRSYRSRQHIQKQFRALGQVVAISHGVLCRSMGLPKLHLAATTIQQCMRGAWGRVHLTKMQKAALVVQAGWRMYVQKCKFRKIRILRTKIGVMVYRYRWRREMLYTIKLNMKLRRVFLRFLPYARETNMSKKVARLARVHRGWLARRHLAKEIKAAVATQSLPRVVRARQESVQKMRALAVLQAGCDSIFKRRTYMKRRRQVARVQAFARGMVLRARVQQMNIAAIGIAKIFRGYSVRKLNCRQNAATIVIGSFVRAFLATLHYQRQKRAVALLQVVWRRVLANQRLVLVQMAATKIASAWKACFCRHRHQRIRTAGASIVSAAWMWQHMRLKERKIVLATKVASIWRGFCVRANLKVLTTSANTICKWWHNRKAYEDNMWIMFELILATKRMKSAHEEAHAIIIQRFARKWLRYRHGLQLVRRMVLTLQSKYRAWGPVRDVELLRAVLGPRVKRLPSQLVALVKDKRGKLTRYRAFRAKERVCPHVARIVRLKVLPPAFREDLAHVTGKIQAFLKHRLRQKRIVTCQKVARGYIVRERIRRQHLAAAKIQSVARRTIIQEEVERFKAIRKNVIVAQAFCRGFLERVRNQQFREAREEESRSPSKASKTAADDDLEEPPKENTADLTVDAGPTL